MLSLVAAHYPLRIRQFSPPYNRTVRTMKSIVPFLFSLLPPPPPSSTSVLCVSCVPSHVSTFVRSFVRAPVILTSIGENNLFSVSTVTRKFKTNLSKRVIMMSKRYSACVYYGYFIHNMYARDNRFCEQFV